MTEQDRTPTPARPHMPKSYGLAADIGAETAAEWPRVIEQLIASRNYWISSTRPDGRPHAMPVWGVWIEGALYFGTDRMSRKGRNIAANPALVVHLESGDDVVVLEGVAAEALDAALLAAYADAYDAKYGFRPDTADPATATYALRPAAVLTWLEADFPGTATRWTFG
ncbi:MAG: pyridoxamine 5'-phosphate oxidase family protein [Chloroflexi bacterium]|nr:pyridoxamine 5'-phosphate oxidase family protein [Chloroflexota bacterium]